MQKDQTKKLYLILPEHLIPPAKEMYGDTVDIYKQEKVPLMRDQKNAERSD